MTATRVRSTVAKPARRAPGQAGTSGQAGPSGSAAAGAEADADTPMAEDVGLSPAVSVMREMTMGDLVRTAVVRTADTPSSAFSVVDVLLAASTVRGTGKEDAAARREVAERLMAELDDVCEPLTATQQWPDKKATCDLAVTALVASDDRVE